MRKVYDTLSVVILMDMPLYPYRIYCYNELAKRGYDLTVVSISEKEEKYNIPLLFKHTRLTRSNWLGFVNIRRFSSLNLSNYDFVVITPNLRVLNFYPLLFGHKYDDRLLAWGHLKGCTSGNPIAARIRKPIMRKMQALIFYESRTKDEYLKKNFPIEKLFVANNTQYVDPETVHFNEERSYFLYVGRIQNRKGLDLAIKAFAQLKKQTEDSKLEFVFVGGGDSSQLKSIAKETGVEKSVKFVGPEHEQAKLGEWFSHAIAYVSPGHVGLGVLHSFACGVPVITCSGRLHSVEISNCKPDNSLVIPYSENDVFGAMKKLYSDKELQKKMSQAAYHYYYESCTIEKMVDGLDDALKFVSKQ